MVFLPEEKAIDNLPRPVPNAIPTPSVATRTQGFVRPSAEYGINELVNCDQDITEVRHSSPPPQPRLPLWPLLRLLFPKPADAQ